MMASGRPRLTASTLSRAHAIRLPGYDRSATPCITHLGFGAFARAHLAVYADELLRRLRQWETPIIARVEDGRVLLDLRTVEPAQDEIIVAALQGITGE